MTWQVQYETLGVTSHGVWSSRKRLAATTWDGAIELLTLELRLDHERDDGTLGVLAMVLIARVRHGAIAPGEVIQLTPYQYRIVEV